MGFPLRDYNEFSPITEGIEEELFNDKYYEPPLIDIIKFACNKCGELLHGTHKH